MPRISRAEFLALKKKSEDRRARRLDNAKFQAEVAGRSRRLTPTKTAIKKKLWNLVSLYVRLRDKFLYGDKCRIGEACGGAGRIEVAYHIIPSNDGAAIRYDFDAIVGACSPCNYGEKNHRWKYRRIHIKIFGKEFVEALETKADEVAQYSTADLLEMIAKVKHLIETRAYEIKNIA